MNSLAQKPKKSDANHIRAMVRQMSVEPFEIAREAANQIIGIDPTLKPSVQVESPQPEEKILTPEEIQAKRERDAKHMQEFRSEIERLQRERTADRDRVRASEEQEKSEQEARSAQTQPFVEPQGRKQRGPQGGGMKKKLHDSERRVEMPKTPTN